MAFDTHPFRTRYRAKIPRAYSAWIHAAFVLLFGALGIGYFWGTARNVQSWEWLTIPVVLVLQNWGEYMVHMQLGHHKRRFAAMFYQRHTGDHHSFFAPGQMAYESTRDWRVILFPPWLVVVYTMALLPAWWLVGLLNMNVACLFAGTMLLGYISYEVLHACEHLPQELWMTRLPWIRHMRRLHELHHRRDLMHTRNFNVVFPLWDWIYGTLHWEPEQRVSSDSARVRIQHSADSTMPPERVLACVSSPTRWHEWHHYKVEIKASPGPLAVGSRFEYFSDRAGNLSWEVTDYVPGRRWQARANGKSGLQMVVAHECQGSAIGTRVTRTLDYDFTGILGHLADRLFLNKRIARDSAELLRNLCQVAEEAPPCEVPPKSPAPSQDQYPTLSLQHCASRDDPDGPPLWRGVKTADDPIEA